MQNVWFLAAAWMGLAFVVSVISIRFGISVALVGIAAGVVAGNFFGLHPADWINFLATFGAGLLTFLAGAEIDPESLRSHRRRAMHEAVFAAGWAADALLPRHRALIAPEHRGRRREVISLDWTLGQHERGPQIDGTTKSYDYVERRMARFQPAVTAVIANRQLLDGIELQIQEPSVRKEEEEYLKATVQASS